jgi:hypothetical protein
MLNAIIFIGVAVGFLVFAATWIILKDNSKKIPVDKTNEVYRQNRY